MKRAALVVLLTCVTDARADVKMDDATKKATGRALEWLARLRPELVQSEPGAPGLGVPQVAAEGVRG